MTRGDERIGWPTLAGLGILVVAFIVLSLLVTATGTARFAVAMGYDATVGYAVGTAFDIAKSVLPVVLPALLVRRALGTTAFLGTAWICLVVFSCLATHATVSTAISAIERTGTWKMELRGNAKAELASVEQQLAALSRPMPPRPAKTVREALVGERVPSGIWKDSQECGSIQESVHFAKACAQIVQLRRELAASEDYERLSARATELRKALAEAPIVATSDPLPATFNATLGRFVPIGGTEGVALLLTMVVEIMSCFGLAGLSALGNSRGLRPPSGSPAEGYLTEGEQEAVDLKEGPQHTLPGAALVTFPKPSLKTVPSGLATAPGRRSREAFNPPSNVVPMRPLSSLRDLGKGGSRVRKGGSVRGASVIGPHVSAFVQDRLQNAPGASLAAKDLRAAYEGWCGTHGYQPLTVPKFAAELKALGYDKWKSCGLIRYRDLQLVA
jgi:hypothetical protein